MIDENERDARIDERSKRCSTDHPTAVTIQYTVERGTRRRLRFEWRTDGVGWWQIEEEWTGCHWRPVGQEVVMEVAVETTSTK